MKWAGIVLIALTGLLHLVETPEYMGEERYIGVLFLLNAIGAAVALLGIWQDRAWGWVLGTAVAGGAFVAYILSRTIGLPAFHESELFEPSGVLSLLIEGGFVVVAARVLMAEPVPVEERRRITPSR
jgi:Kef-type K+ transport system membrane component KefB